MTMSAWSRSNARRNRVIAGGILLRFRRRILREIQKNRREKIWRFDLRDVTDSLENFKLTLRNLGGGAFRERWIVASLAAPCVLPRQLQAQLHCRSVVGEVLLHLLRSPPHPRRSIDGPRRSCRRCSFTLHQP
jgi:hypothetical protein